YNVANACATGATALRTAIMAVKAGETDMGLAVGVEKLSGAGLLSGGTRKEEGNTWTPRGRYGAVAPVDGRIGTETMPGVFAQVGMEYLHDHPYDRGRFATEPFPGVCAQAGMESLHDHPYDGEPFRLFARISEKNHSHSTLN